MEEETWPVEPTQEAEQENESESVEPSSSLPTPSPPPYSSPEPKLTNIYFNVLRQLPDADNKLKWTKGQEVTGPLMVETASLPEGAYRLTPMSAVSGVQTDEDIQFIKLVEKWGVWCISDGDRGKGAAAALIPGINGGWTLTPDVFIAMKWRTV